MQQTSRKKSKIWMSVGWSAAMVAVIGVYAVSIAFARWEKEHAPPLPLPYVCLTRPDKNETNVLPNTFIAADIYLPNFGSGVMPITMNTHNVRLMKVVGNHETQVAGHVNTSGAGDSIVFQPMDMLDVDSKYHFRVDGVRDTSGALFMPYDMTFTTAPATALSRYPVAFDHIQMKKTWGNIFTGLTVGPDHQLYAGTFDGRIMRYDFLPDGTLSDPFVIKTVLNANKGPENATGNRLITGICFDPTSTPDNMVLWITNGVCAIEHCPDWSCKVSRLSGPDLNHYEDYVVGLPRAWRDHLSFKIQFGPDGGLYFNQGSSSSTGAPDNKWGLRNEHLLTAACLRLDTKAVADRLAAGGGPLNVKTEDDGQPVRNVAGAEIPYEHYTPFAPGAPLTLYATGIRCGFSMLWHTNGKLYSCLNGGAAGGAAPGTPEDLADVPHRNDEARFGKYNGGAVPAIPYVSETQPDLFISIEKGAFYGHPNVTRGEYVMFGGNPDGGSDNYQVHDYPLGTKPDRNWHPAYWSLGISLSCNGLIEYKSNTFGGALKGKILTTRYSGGKDIEVLTPGTDGKIIEAITGIDGFNQFIDPLDLVEDQNTGNLYVSEFGGQKLTLLKPREASTESLHTIREKTNKSRSGKSVTAGR
jgi:hypothetical protein